MSGTPAGWHADPYGRHEQRYFDGETWSENISDGGRQGRDPVDENTPVLAPIAPVRQPAPMPVYGGSPGAYNGPPTVIVKHRSPWPWIFLGIFVFFGLGIVGCFALVGTAANEAVNELNREQARHAISQAQFDAVVLGSSRVAVQTQLDKEPENAQEFVTKGVFDESQINTSCIYYNKRGGEFGDRYQFCFDGDALRSKNAY